MGHPAVKRHQLLDVIQKASVTAIRQILWRDSSIKMWGQVEGVSPPSQRIALGGSLRFDKIGPSPLGTRLPLAVSKP